jgi:NitT/TauT family transport system ATP-binding protein
MSRLRLSGVAHAYALKEVLSDIDLTLDAGRVLALVGPSGCGKTTLLHLCAGLLTCQTGTLDNGFARPAVMFQQPRLLPWKTARDNIALGLKAAGLPRAEWQMRAQAMGHAVGLDATALDQFPHQLSGGMQSRAALARALVLEPDLLLMDEPFSALDIGLAWCTVLLREQALSGSPPLITHDLVAVRLADTILVMHGAPGTYPSRTCTRPRPCATTTGSTTPRHVSAHAGRARLLGRAHHTRGAKPVLHVMDLAPARSPLHAERRLPHGLAHQPSGVDVRLRRSLLTAGAARPDAALAGILTLGTPMPPSPPALAGTRTNCCSA